MFNRSHLALTLVFRVSGDLLDALSFLLGTMNWNLLLHTEFFLQVINTTACTWVRIQILHAQTETDALLTGLCQAPDGSSLRHRDLAYCTTAESWGYQHLFLLWKYLHAFYFTLMEHWIYSRQDSYFNLIFQLRWLDMKLSCMGSDNAL